MTFYSLLLLLATTTPITTKDPGRQGFMCLEDGETEIFGKEHERELSDTIKVGYWFGKQERYNLVRDNF